MEEPTRERYAEQFGWIENNPCPVFVYRADRVGEILHANQEFLKLFECASLEDFEEEKGGRTILQVVCPEDIPMVVSEVREQQRKNPNGFNHGQYRIITKSGKVIHVEDFGKVIIDPVLGPLIFVYVINTNVQFTEYGLDRQTNLPGAQRFYKYLTRQIEESTLEQVCQMKVLYFNIRNFRSYNLRMGEEQGDELLYRLAQLLKVSFVNAAYLARATEDHFLLVTSSPTFREEFESARRQFDEMYVAYGLQLKAGVYEVHDQQKTALFLCELAKAACDNIRKSHESLHIYDDALRRKLKMRNYVTKNIDVAMENHYIEVYYQPVIRIDSGKLCSMEALARWNDPTHGILSPADFIPILEEKRQIHRLDLYMFREVCKVIRSTMDHGVPVALTSFNLSRADFNECDIFREVEEIVQEYQVPRDMIHVEITESAMVDDAEMIQREIDRFREAGYEVWMDDFGSGYSSLNTLKNSRFDEIKLDMIFLRNLNANGKKIIQAIISMAKAIGLRTVAEGVETEEQLEFLRMAGCDQAQGYFFGRPCPIVETVRNNLAKGLEVETAEERALLKAQTAAMIF